MVKKKEYQPLTVPRLSWNKDTLSPEYGELVVQPLEPGFGITLGNALRRILLGAIEGSAVTSVTINGVNNEFSTIPGVVEDAMQVLLNIKSIVIKNKTGVPGSMRLRVSGESVARVADIQHDDHLELINPDHVLAHVAPGGTLDIEFFVEQGRGYRPAQWPVGQRLQEDGRIYLDAMFSPVRKVLFDVEKTRVGSEIDYDRLFLAIQTDASEAPTEVLHYAVSVLRSQLEHFLSIPEISFNSLFPVVQEQAKTEKSLSDDVITSLKGVAPDLLLKDIDVLEFTVRAYNCLKSAGINRILDLVTMQEEEVLKIKNFGRKSFEEVKDNMRKFGLTFDMNIKESDVLKALAQQGSSQS